MSSRCRWAGGANAERLLCRAAKRTSAQHPEPTSAQVRKRQSLPLAQRERHAQRHPRHRRKDDAARSPQTRGASAALQAETE